MEQCHNGNVIPFDSYLFSNIWVARRHIAIKHFNFHFPKFKNPKHDHYSGPSFPNFEPSTQRRFEHLHRPALPDQHGHQLHLLPGPPHLPDRQPLRLPHVRLHRADRLSRPAAIRRRLHQDLQLLLPNLHHRSKVENECMIQ